METPNKVIKNRFTPEQIQELILQWHQSGLNRRKFCEKLGFNYYTFGTWCEKYSKQQTDSAFTEVKIRSGSLVFAKLSFPNGSHVEFYQPVNAKYFQDLLQ